MPSFITSLICTLNILLCLQATSTTFASKTAAKETRRLLKERRHEIFSRTLHHHFNQYGSELQHEIAHPRRITRQGDHLEYATLDPLSEIRPTDGRVRKRRDIPSREASHHLDATEMVADGGHLVYYDLGAQQHDSGLSGALLKLRRNYQLVSKNFVVEERGKGGVLLTRHNMVTDCHYTGVIDNHSGFSKVAMSLCNGLQGIIHKDNETFFIEPKWNHTTESDKDDQSHPHIITKRNIVQDLSKRAQDPEDNAHCGMSDSTIDGKTPWYRQEPSTSSKSHHHTNNGRAGTAAKDDEAKSRSKRSTSVERNVETLVVADKNLVTFHGREDLQKYLLTIMNTVGSLYHDATIGNAVNIIVTRMILLAEEQPGLKLNHHADQSLQSFCKWQAGLVGDDTETNVDLGLERHDNAVLITGLDICSTDNSPCSTLGLAPLRSVCDINRSCNINEDTGIATAHTIAHEIGHNFGMQHDGVNNECGTPNGEPAKIMAPAAAMTSNPFQWSRCSRKYITDYLDGGNGACLLDSPPQRDFKFSEELPGQIYDASEQCRFQFGPSSRECSFGKACRKLWCIVNMTDAGIVNGCITNNIPAAEGTNCSSDEIEYGWCNRGECVQFGFTPLSIDGSWGAWSSWAECSRTCGTGVSMSQRSCNSPPPESGGRYCIGKRKRYKSCSTDPCPANAKDFRSMQCEVFDHEPFRGRYYNWFPFEVDRHIENPCALNCIARGHKFYSEKSRTVIDGTRCFPDSLNLCINGECHHVGCDNVLHSDAVEDKCRVCGGDGSSCITHAGVFDGGDSHGQYHRIVTIPKGSVNVFVEEVLYSQRNYIALQGTDNQDYLNADWAIEWPRSLNVAGTTFVYKRPNDEPESLRARGPTNIDLDILVLLQEPNSGIKYEFNVPVDNADGSGLVPESVFIWEFADWTPCSASCAGGIQRKAVLCKRLDDDTTVQHRFCDSRTMPIEDERSCNLEPCPATWFIGVWEECSSTCGGGVRDRLVMCMRTISRTDDETVPDHYCLEDKPTSEQQCNQEECPPEWVTGKWQRCSVTCGSGLKWRDVLCMSADRSVKHPVSACDSRQKPVEKSQCDMDPCPPVRWRTGPWSDCSAKCGHGQRKRRVVCRQGNQQVHPSRCPKQRPKNISTCRSHQACSSPTSSSRPKQCVDDPKVDYCTKVRRYGFCSRTYFKKMCCASCTQRR